MPDGEGIKGVSPAGDFEKQLADWEKKRLRATSQRENFANVSQGLPGEQVMRPRERQVPPKALPAPGLALLSPASVLQLFTGKPPSETGIKSIDEGDRRLQAELDTSNQILKYVFYEEIYGVVPALVAADIVNSPDEALSYLSIPPDLAEGELDAVRAEITQLLASRRRGVRPTLTAMGPAVPTEERPGIGEEVTLPPLEAPKPVRAVPVTSSQLSVQEIMKALRAPKVPESAMTKEEWDAHLKSKGWSDEDVKDELRIRKDQLIAEALNRKSMIEEFRKNGAKLPERTIKDFLITAVTQPPLAALEMLGMYFEKVSAPNAGWMYQNIPDIQKAYQDFKRLNPDAGNREAYGYAWEKWKGVGPPVLDWVFKYMIMEGLVDPVTYVGWGVGTKLLRPLGPVGRVLSRGNHAISEVLEAPFDFIKWIRDEQLPKTITQRAAKEAGEAVAVLTRGFELLSKKPYTDLQPKDMQKAGREMLAHILIKPQAEDDVAKAAHALLVHPPLSEKEVSSWIRRLRALKAETIDPASLTARELLDIDTIFERVMGKEITADEAATHLLQKLGAQTSEGITEDMSVFAAKVLADRANEIFDGALDFTLLKTRRKAMEAYSRKATKALFELHSSKVLAEQLKQGRFRALLVGVERGLVKLWPKRIEEFVIRDFAASYLAFAGYGPMNTIEDVWRSVMGGVKPGRHSIEQTRLLVTGLLDDPQIYRGGVSEMLGPLRDIGEPHRTNWILTGSMMPLSSITYLATLGKVTPKQFAEGYYKAAVEFWGAMGADIRRNFRDGRYQQILADLGGQSYQDLLSVTKAALPQELKSAPRWVKQAVKRDVRNAVLTGQLTPDNTELVKALKARFTRSRVVQAEVDDILKKYPDVSPSSRSMVFDDFRELTKSPDSIKDFMKRVMENEVDDFLKSPERAKEQFKALADVLVAFDVQRPADMAELIVSLNRMSQTYGAVPAQVMARATIKSEGLPLAQRSAHFDVEFDRVHSFMEKAGIELDRVVEKVRGVDPGLSDSYKVARGKYLDLTTALRKVLSDARLKDMTYRHEVFAAAPKKTPQFWDDFYAHEMNYWNGVKGQMATLNSQMAEALDSLSEAAALQARDKLGRFVAGAPARPPRSSIVIEGRPLAPADVAKLVGTRGDDLSRMLLDNLIVEGDRDYFIEYIMGRVRAGDKGFTRESVSQVYDQIAAAMMIDPKSSSWFRARQMQIDAMTRDFHDLYNAKLLPQEQKVAIDKYIDDVTAEAGKLVKEQAIPAFDVGLNERVVTREAIALVEKDIEALKGKMTAAELASYREQAGQVALLPQAEIQKMKDELTQAARQVPLPGIKARSLADIQKDILADERILDLIPDIKDTGIIQRDVEGATHALQTAYERLSALSALGILSDPKKMALWRKISNILDDLDDIRVGRTTLEYAVRLWFEESTNDALQDLGRIASRSPEYLAKIKGILKEKYPTGYIRVFRGSGAAKHRFLDREYTNVTSSRSTAKGFEDTWTTAETKEDLIALQTEYQIKISELVDAEGKPKKALTKYDIANLNEMKGTLGIIEAKMKGSKWRAEIEPKPSLDNVLIKVDDVVSIGSVDESELIIPAGILKDRIANPLQAPVVTRPAFQSYQSLRQQALDEANKWYYKEYTDYTNANAIDTVFKTLYPFWTYESQRWFWLPRSFLRRPGTLTAWSRWENNTDYGNIHVPGTSIDVNPARGTIYGPWSTRLLRRDFPEYYDQLDGMGGMVGFFDFLSRYGFYPNVIFGALLAQYGGREAQTGGVLPSTLSTPLMALVAAFPDNKLVSFISERVFPEQFRNYLTARGVDDLGGDGSLIFAKRKANQALTPEEEQLWTEARRSTAVFNVMAEQTGMIRMRTDKAYEVSKAAEQFIFEQWGITPEQQKEARLHNVKLWDLIGGLDPWESAAMQELEFFKYSGSINPVLPSMQQEILNKIELDWSAVRDYTEQMRNQILQLQDDFLKGSERGRLGPDAFLGRVRALFDDRRKFIDDKVKKNPLMLLKNRADYYLKYGQTMPVQSPYNELMSMYFDINLEESVDPGTGERVYDWKKFWANRSMIEEAIPEDDKGQWTAFITRHTAPIMQVWYDTYNAYLSKYYDVWEAVKKTYPDNEQKLIEEFLFLERTGQKLDRQAVIREMTSEKDGNQLMSSFRSEVSKSREALRYANSQLDAWLFYWGRVKSFKTDRAALVYQNIARQTQRKLD